MVLSSQRPPPDFIPPLPPTPCALSVPLFSPPTLHTHGYSRDFLSDPLPHPQEGTGPPCRTLPARLLLCPLLLPFDVRVAVASLVLCNPPWPPCRVHRWIQKLPCTQQGLGTARQQPRSPRGSVSGAVPFLTSHCWLRATACPPSSQAACSSRFSCFPGSRCSVARGPGCHAGETPWELTRGHQAACGSLGFGTNGFRCPEPCFLLLLREAAWCPCCQIPLSASRHLDIRLPWASCVDLPTPSPCVPLGGWKHPHPDGLFLRGSRKLTFLSPRASETRLLCPPAC